MKLEFVDAIDGECDKTDIVSIRGDNSNNELILDGTLIL